MEGWVLGWSPAEGKLAAGTSGAAGKMGVLPPTAAFPRRVEKQRRAERKGPRP